MSRAPSYTMLRCSLEAVRELCVAHHGYGSAGGVGVYCFGVYESGQMVAGYAWQPPHPGAAKSVCPEAPQGVLSLSRMVAVPKAERRLNHVSKPLRRQMRTAIDRGRWPVLITFSDEGEGHTGHAYKCSGWERTVRSERDYALNSEGRRASLFSNGKRSGLPVAGTTVLQRWEHWACIRGRAGEHMADNGWARVPVHGKFWKSGAQAHRWTVPHPELPWGS